MSRTFEATITNKYTGHVHRYKFDGLDPPEEYIKRISMCITDGKGTIHLGKNLIDAGSIFDFYLREIYNRGY